MPMEDNKQATPEEMKAREVKAKENLDRQAREAREARDREAAAAKSATDKQNAENDKRNSETDKQNADKQAALVAASQRARDQATKPAAVHVNELMGDPAPKKTDPAPKTEARRYDDAPPEQNWELPDGTTRQVLKDGSTVYLLPDGTQRHEHAGQPSRYFLPSNVAALDAKSVDDIAEKVRGHVDLNYSQKVHPDQQHMQAVAKQVTEKLGMEPNALNVNHVAGLINEHVARPSAEYPKMFYDHAAHREITVANRKEEDDLGPGLLPYHWSAPKPEEADMPAAKPPEGGKKWPTTEEGWRDVNRPHPAPVPNRVEPSPGDA